MTSNPASDAVAADRVELSVVLPCLNEADTLEACLRKVQAGLAAAGIAGEVLVADNGSTDGSPIIARQLGARVVHVSATGYGHALMGGIAAARGRYIIMGDADDSYDFQEIPRFVEKLRAGYELVQGCRLPNGGGRVMPGAMPLLHRWLGNPLFSLLARWWFGAPIHDVYCGLRGFTRALYERLKLHCTGMEFATEMIIKASLHCARITEVPITLHPDARKAHAPHLKTFRDGWRTLRFFLLCSPRWLFLMPGALLVALGLIGYAIALPGLTIGRLTFDAHTLLFASLFILCGYQSILFAIFTKTFALNEGFLPPDPRLMRFYKVATLERGLALSALAMLVGIGLLAAAGNQWRLANFGPLNYAHTMRLVVPGATLTALAFQTMLSSFFVSILGMPRSPGLLEFDAFATCYDEALEQGLRVSGESKEFFAAERVAWLAKCLAPLGVKPKQVLDFGCGTGSSTPYLLGLNAGCTLTGLEVSRKSLELAQQQYGSARTRFVMVEDYQPASEIDLAFCNGVFHHIAPAERAEAVKLVFRALRPGGVFAFWENNPWNPGTRYVMSRIPFDRDAITLSYLEARRMLRAGGFEILRTDFLFYFPRFLKILRRLEPRLAGLPLGAQYLVLCRKP